MLNTCTFWKGGRVEIIRHCDRVFTLEVDGEQDMGPTSFEQILRYVQWEYPIEEFDAAHDVGKGAGE